MRPEPGTDPAGRSPVARRGLGLRLAGGALTLAALLLGLSFALFALLEVMPGRPEDLLLAANPELRAEDVARIRRVRGLDCPRVERWGCWLVGQGEGRCVGWPSERGLLGGDLGWSTVHKLPVAELLATRLPATLRLTIPAFLLALVGSIALGVVAARRRGRLADHLVSGLSFVSLSLPTHWLALMLVLVFAVELRWLPPSGVRDPLGPPRLLDELRHLVLPVGVLALFWLGRWTRFVRAALLEVLELDFVRTARAKGLSERQVLLHHALPNALVPLVTVVAQSLPALFSGALVVERVFAYPGMGLLVYESVVGSDYLVAVVVFLAYAALTALATLAAEGAYALLDPRVGREDRR